METVNSGQSGCEDERCEGETESKRSVENECVLGGPRFYPPLYKQRYSKVASLLSSLKVKTVVDFGCAECKFLKCLKENGELIGAFGVDIDATLVRINKQKICPQAWDYLFQRQADLHMKLFVGDITVYESRLHGVEAVTMIEVVEHLEDDVLEKFPEMVFRRMSPKYIIMTTPNSEFNILFPNFSGFRHPDHKFEWTRKEFQKWCEQVAVTYGYNVEYDGIGEPPEGSPHVGHCSQMALFVKQEIAVEEQECDSSQDQPYELVAESVFPSRESHLTPEQNIVNEAEYYISLLAREWLNEDRYDANDPQDTCIHQLPNTRTDSEETMENDTNETETICKLENTEQSMQKSNCDRVHISNHNSQGQMSPKFSFANVRWKENASKEMPHNDIMTKTTGEEKMELIEEVMDSDNCRVISVPISKLLTFKQLSQLCSDPQRLRDLLMQAGHRLSPDGSSVLYDVMEQTSEEEETSEEENEDDKYDDEEEDWNEDNEVKEDEKSKEEEKEDTEEEDCDNYKEEAESKSTGFIYKKSVDFFTSQIGQMTIEDYNWSPEESYTAWNYSSIEAGPNDGTNEINETWTLNNNDQENSNGGQVNSDRCNEGVDPAHCSVDSDCLPLEGPVVGQFSDAEGDL